MNTRHCWLRFSVQLFVLVFENVGNSTNQIEKIDRVNAHAIAWAKLIFQFGHFLQPSKPDEVKFTLFLWP